jgi:hypothetical protein
VKTGTVGNTLKLNTNTLEMNIMLYIITGIIAISAVVLVLTSLEIFRDKNGNKIPDWLEDKFSEIKQEIKKLKK